MKQLILFTLLLSITQVGIGQKLSIQDFELVYNEELHKGALRDVVQIGIKATTNSGEQLMTKGYLGGKMKWSEFKVEVQGGKFMNGKIIIDAMGKNFPNLAVEVKAYHKGNSSKVKELFIPIQHGREITCSCEWTTGPLIKVDNSEVHVFVRDAINQHSGENMLVVMVKPKNFKEPDIYIFNPSKTELTIDCNGHEGSTGSSSTGVGGKGGDGGNGSNVQMFISPGASRTYQQAITVKNQGGRGGAGGDGDIADGYPGRDGRNGTFRTTQKDVDEIFREYYTRKGFTKTFLDEGPSGQVNLNDPALEGLSDIGIDKPDAKYTNVNTYYSNNIKQEFYVPDDWEVEDVINNGVPSLQVINPDEDFSALFVTTAVPLNENSKPKKMAEFLFNRFVKGKRIILEPVMINGMSGYLAYHEGAMSAERNEFGLTNVKVYSITDGKTTYNLINGYDAKGFEKYEGLLDDCTLSFSVE